MCNFVSDSMSLPSSSDFLWLMSPFILATYAWNALASSSLSSSPLHFSASSWFYMSIYSELIDISSTLDDNLIISSE